jgi:hypothetical protein
VTLDEELRAFYLRSAFGDTPGKRPLTVRVYTGCLLVPLPNIETRSRYLKYHDLHHLITGYGVGRIGEGEVSAWELGTGSFLRSPTLGFMNLIALSTGLVLDRKRMWRAFVRGCQSRNLYSTTSRGRVDAGHWASLEDIRQHALNVRPSGPGLLRRIEYAGYCSLSCVIHAAIAAPAVLLRLITDIGLGYSFFEAVKPRKRVDLY